MVALRPSLHAAFALARQFGSFSPILKGIAEGNVSILTFLFAECGSGFGNLLSVPGRSLASRLAELCPIAGELVVGLMGVDLDARSESKTADRNEKAFDLVEHYETLFSFATAILRWTPEAAWNATPGEIIAAMEYRAKVYAPKEDKPDHGKLTLDQQAMLLSARLDMRRTDAE